MSLCVDLQSLQHSKWRASTILNPANLAKTLRTRLIGFTFWADSRRLVSCFKRLVSIGAKPSIWGRRLPVRKNRTMERLLWFGASRSPCSNSRAHDFSLRFAVQVHVGAATSVKQPALRKTHLTPIKSLCGLFKAVQDTTVWSVPDLFGCFRKGGFIPRI